jgi:endonuclease/exonuclease/phosphatase family metal-dependent hydrolase
LSYIGQLHRALQIYETFVQQKPTVIVGDLNANAIWDHGKPWQYRAVINALNQRGSVSIYHALTKEPYGQERQDTYQHHTGTGFHIDHCFVPDAWITPASRVWIGDDVWLSRSDHRPFIVDLELNAVA